MTNGINGIDSPGFKAGETPVVANAEEQWPSQVKFNGTAPHQSTTAIRQPTGIAIALAGTKPTGGPVEYKLVYPALLR